MQKEKEAKPKYRSADKLTFDDIIKSIPEQLKPTPRMNWILGAIFLVVIIIGALTFPLSSMMRGDLDIKFAIGYPMDFFVLNLENAEEIPFKFAGLIVDTLLYILIAYAIDVSLNVFFSSSIIKSFSKEKETRPQKYNLSKQSKAPATIQDKQPPRPHEEQTDTPPKDKQDNPSSDQVV